MKNLRKLRDEEVAEVNEQFLKRFPSRRLFSLLNIDREYTMQTTQWNILRNEKNYISGLLCYDERDNYLTLFGSPESVAPLLRLTLGFDKAPKYQYKNVYYSYLFGCVQSHLGNALKQFLTEELQKPILTYGEYDLWEWSEPEWWRDHTNRIHSKFQVESLREEDAEEVNRHWTYASARSLAIVLEAIKSRPSACIRSYEDIHNQHSNGNQSQENIRHRTLLSWAVVRSDYSIGMLYTKEAYRGKGLASAVLTHLTTTISQIATDDGKCPVVPHVYIDPDNSTSQHIHSRLGYTKKDSAIWLRV
jgi:GNAT superfamily N-acetyltransferase